MTIRAERYDDSAHYLYDGTVLVGFALLLTNGRWIWTDTKDVRRTVVSFKTPKAVAEFVTGKMTRGKPVLP